MFWIRVSVDIETGLFAWWCALFERYFLSDNFEVVGLKEILDPCTYPVFLVGERWNLT